MKPGPYRVHTKIATALDDDTPATLMALSELIDQRARCTAPAGWRVDDKLANSHLISRQVVHDIAQDLMVGESNQECPAFSAIAKR